MSLQTAAQAIIDTYNGMQDEWGNTPVPRKLIENLRAELALSQPPRIAQATHAMLTMGGDLYACDRHATFAMHRIDASSGQICNHCFNDAVQAAIKK